MQKIRNLSVEISKIEDYDLSSILFEENFKSIDKDIYTYSWSDINSVSDIIYDIERKYYNDFNNEDELLDFYRFLQYETECYEDLEEAIKNDESINNIDSIIDAALDEYLDGLYYNYKGGVILNCIISELIDNGFIPYERYEIIETRGYSQGDYAEIIVDTDEFEEVIGTKFDYDIEQKFVDEIFWDTPMNFYVKASYQIECEGYPIINAVDDDFYEIEEVGSSDYYSDWRELEKAVNKIKKEVLEIFNKRYKTSFNEEVNWKISEELL